MTRQPIMRSVTVAVFQRGLGMKIFAIIVASLAVLFVAFFVIGNLAWDAREHDGVYRSSQNEKASALTLEECRRYNGTSLFAICINKMTETYLKCVKDGSC